MIAAVPLDETSQGEDGGGVQSTALSPEERARAVVERLEGRVGEAGATEIEERCDYLSLLRRWYYRPEKQRTGAILFPNPDGAWPVRRLLNAAAREALGPPREAAPVERGAAKDMKTRVLHEGREGVERVVPVLPKRGRRKKVELPSEVPEQPTTSE
jgi:hypothetical protein